MGKRWNGAGRRELWKNRNSASCPKVLKFPNFKTMAPRRIQPYILVSTINIQTPKSPAWKWKLNHPKGTVSLSFLPGPPSCLHISLQLPLHPVSVLWSHGLLNICLCSVLPRPLHGPWVFGLKPPSLLAPLSSSLKYVQIFLILKKKKKHFLDLTSLPTTFSSQQIFSKTSLFSTSPLPPWSTEIHLSSCHFSATALPESMRTLFYLTHRAWADLTALEHLRPSWSSRTTPFYVLGASHSAGFLLLNPSFILAFFPGFLLLTPLSTTQRGDTIRAPSFHLFSSHWEYSCWVTLWLHLSSRCPRFQGQHL